VLGTRKKRSASGSTSFQEMDLKLDPLSNSYGTGRNENTSKCSIPPHNPIILKFKVKNFDLVMVEYNVWLGSAAEVLHT
jgi:hypothetical protein